MQLQNIRERMLVLHARLTISLIPSGVDSQDAETTTIVTNTRYPQLRDWKCDAPQQAAPEKERRDTYYCSTLRPGERESTYLWFSPAAVEASILRGGVKKKEKTPFK